MDHISINDFSNHVRARGFRMTPQRLVILQILRETGGHQLPIQIVQLAQKRMPGMTEATVYRTLSFLAQQGLVMAAHIGNGQMVYEVAEHAHHHLICRKCGITQEIGHPALARLYTELGQVTGFKIDSMHVTFFGTCPGCQENPQEPASPTELHPDE